MTDVQSTRGVNGDRRYDPTDLPRLRLQYPLTMNDLVLASRGEHPVLPLHNRNGDTWRNAIRAGGFNKLFRPDTPCRECGRDQVGMWFMRINANGTEIATLRCVVCSLEMRTIGASKFPMRLPVWQDYTADYIPPPPCERCGSTGGTELHHWAPSYLFGAEAHQWPTSWLCRPCHMRWHSVVTPRMSQRKAS